MGCTVGQGPVDAAAAVLCGSTMDSSVATYHGKHAHEYRCTRPYLRVPRCNCIAQRIVRSVNTAGEYYNAKQFIAFLDFGGD
jgi:hypothetical protein